MSEIINDVEKLKELIIKSDEYVKYQQLTKKLDENKDINILVEDIKNLQKQIVYMEVKDEKTFEKEKELKELYNKLNSYDIYKEYVEAAKKLNKLITKIQKKFENYINDILI